MENTLSAEVTENCVFRRYVLDQKRTLPQQVTYKIGNNPMTGNALRFARKTRVEKSLLHFCAHVVLNFGGLTLAGLFCRLNFNRLRHE